ncbi:hypothetical protein HZB93_00060 [Candidatus Falkowbacteria bacterium]|nr:hypothetical protein [Candidatus Falkowbacteria bacterium]
MDLPFVLKTKLTRERLIWCAISAALFLLAVGLIIWLAVIYLPAPKFTGFPTVTNQEKVTLRGTARADAVVVIFDKDKKAVAMASADAEGNFIFENVSLVAGENKFTARALNAVRRSSRTSGEIVIKFDTAAPTLEVQSAAGLVVNDKNYIASGKAAPGSIVTVNGVAATVGADGTWSANIPLTSGENNLTVTATDPAGNLASTTETVTYVPIIETNANENVNAAVNTNAEAGANTNANTNTETNTNTATNTNTNTNTAPPPPAIIIGVVGQISNPTPNVRGNETITATVKDGAGNPITNATVKAVAHYNSGNITYTLVHSGGGVYAVSFKIGTSAEVGYKVLVDISASFGGGTGSTRVSFTPRQ